MATTYKNMVLKEAIDAEANSKVSWGQQHGSDRVIFPMDTEQFAKLDKLKERVADLCDLQPTQASMVRPPRKVRATTSMRTCASFLIFCARLLTPLLCTFFARRHSQANLRKLKEELALSLKDVEDEIEQLGGSASTVTSVNGTAKSLKPGKALSVASSIAE